MYFKPGFSFRLCVLAKAYLSQDDVLIVSARLMQHSHILLQLSYCQLHGLHVALHSLHLLPLLPPELLQHADLLILQDLMESCKLPFDPSLQICSHSLQQGQMSHVTD